MSSVADFPEILAEALAIASERIGSDRALITLQGILSGYKSIRIIDGIIRDETIQAIAAAEKHVGIDGLLDLYLWRLLERFPDEFADLTSWAGDDEDDDDELEEQEAEIEPSEPDPAPVKKRRRAR